MNDLYKQFWTWGFFFIWISQVNIFPTDLCGPTSGTLTFAGSPYIVTCNVLVPDGQTLSIEPGVIIKFNLEKILQVDGTLIAEGKAGNNIMFTSNNSVPGAGDWGEIYFMQSENSILHYCTIEHAGEGGSPITALNLWFSNVSIQNTIVRNNRGSGINISNSDPTISNCLIEENTGIGIDSDIGSAPIISDCDINNNGYYAISMFAHNINNIGPVTITGNTNNSIRVWEGNVSDGNWANHDVPYVIDGNITVADGQTLTLDPGIELLFNGLHTFEVDGSLVAIGGPGNEISFTSNKLNPSAGDWRQLYFNNSEPSTLKYCDIGYGGSNTAAINMLNSNPSFEDVWVFHSATNGINLSNSSPEIINGFINNNAGIGILASFDSNPIINSCTIQNSGDYAISMFADNIKNIIGDMFIVNNTKNSIRVEGETVHTGTWLDHSGGAQIAPYVIAGNISVADGATLILEPGVELRFNGDYIFEVNGALVAEGSANEYITFTSNEENPQPGDWRFLSFNLSDPATNLNYCKILYGGSNTAALNISLSNFSITNTIVMYSEQRGINISQSSPFIRNCFIEENLGDGIYINSGNPDLGTANNPGNNTFRLNSGWELFNNGVDTIYAVWNFWVDTDSAAIDANHIYDDDENSSKGIVVFLPFLKTPPTDVEEIEDQIIPNEIVLEQNYPNPFNPSTNIRYSIPSESFVELKVYDLLGCEIATLVNEWQKAGVYRADFTANNLPSGMYFARITANEFTQVVKMILLK